MITREGDYAIRAILYLAAQPNGRPVATSELADRMVVPYRFLRRIVQKLVDGRLLKAQRGKGGGVRLARPGRSISLFDVLSVVDPKALCVNECLDGEMECVRAAYCTIRPRLQSLQETIARELRSIPFDALQPETVLSTSAKR